MRVGLTELQQLMRSFSYCYQTQLRAWCNKQQPQLSQLGADFKRVHGELKDFTELLRNMDLIHDNHVKLCGPIRERLEQLRYKQLQRDGKINTNYRLDCNSKMCISDRWCLTVNMKF